MIKGIVRDKYGTALCGVTIYLKNERFETLVTDVTKEDGTFFIPSDDIIYSHMVAVREYKEKYLEYWCNEIDNSMDHFFDIIIDKLEVYGLNVFSVKGGYKSLFLYFRPMSLVKFKNGDSDIFPDVKEIKIRIDGRPSEILEMNPVKESYGSGEMKALLIQVAQEDSSSYRKIDVILTDTDGNMGMASYIREKR